MTLDELRTLLALNGNQRLAHLESEIFSDINLYTCYLESICSKYTWYKGYEKEKSDNGLACLAYWYSELIIKVRFVEAESVIATDPYCSYYYARDIIGGRWPEGEPAISRDRVFAISYNCEFGANI